MNYSLVFTANSEAVVQKQRIEDKCITHLHACPYTADSHADVKKQSTGDN